MVRRWYPLPVSSESTRYCPPAWRNRWQCLCPSPSRPYRVRHQSWLASGRQTVQHWEYESGVASYISRLSPELSLTPSTSKSLDRFLSPSTRDRARPGRYKRPALRSCPLLPRFLENSCPYPSLRCHLQGSPCRVGPGNFTPSPS